MPSGPAIANRHRGPEGSSTYQEWKSTVSSSAECPHDMPQKVFFGSLLAPLELPTLCYHSDLQAHIKFFHQWYVWRHSVRIINQKQNATEDSPGQETSNWSEVCHGVMMFRPFDLHCKCLQRVKQLSIVTDQC